MRFEIAVYAEPSFLDLLSQRLTAALPSQCLPSLSLLPMKEKTPGLFLLAGDPKTMDSALILVSREVEDLEKCIATKPGEARLSVRNLEYGEPSPAFSPRSPFKPVSSITIYPWTGDSTVDHPSDVILLDSSSAFGSGTHPTTILCLEFLEEMGIKKNISASLEGSSVLDFGCGTGILAIAAVKLGALRADGVEIDHEAAQTACRNVRLNRLDDKIAIIEGSFDLLTAKYGVILANLVAAAQLRVGMDLPEHLNPDGYILISGFGIPQASQIEQIYTGKGLKALERRDKEGWTAVLFCKS